ncbi:MAG TPA: hypothetical protein VJS42_06200 [Steroidobacteraceae bacterium]|nr:hypothetical protein [Steroidobacteraceae bacterium]
MGEFLKAAAHRVLVAALLIALAACGGGGGGGGGSSGGSNTTVSGKITFDRVPVGSNGLNFNAVTQSPARQVVVEAIQSSSSAVLDSTTTDTSGNYTLTVPTNTSLFIRAKAQMTRSGSWDFSVKNNTNANALYVLDGSAFDSGSAGSTRNLNAASGWTGSAYTQTRAAAPFAILDTIFQAKELLLSAQATLAFPSLDLYWSDSNRASDSFCPSSSLIGTTSFITASPGDTDDCSPPQALSAGIYVLGAFSDPSTSDTDEFDQHVLAHEFGHYVEASFSRTDSIGGTHGFGEALDPRVAFGEGWGNAFSGMVLTDPNYRDSFGTGTGTTGGFHLDANAEDIPGWYSEAAVGQILWDLFDGGVEPGIDNVQVPFSTLFSVLAGPEKNTEAFTTIFSFSDALIAADPMDTSAINTLLSFESVNGSGAYASGEFDFNGDLTQPQAVYINIAANNTPIPVCTNGSVGVYNKLNNRRFLKLDLSAAGGTHTITVAGAPVLGGGASPNPQVVLWGQGQRLASATGNTAVSTRTIPARQFAAGIYLIEVYDSQFGSVSGDEANQPRCMNVTVN